MATNPATVPSPKSPSAAKPRVKVDPALRQALKKGAADEQFVVLVKIDSKTGKFSRYAVSNKPGSKREQVFRDDLKVVIDAVDPAKANPYTARILNAAANVGVATLEAPKQVVEKLMKSPAVTGMKLLGS